MMVEVGRAKEQPRKTTGIAGHSSGGAIHDVNSVSQGFLAENIGI